MTRYRSGVPAIFGPKKTLETKRSPSTMGLQLKPVPLYEGYMSSFHVFRCGTEGAAEVLLRAQRVLKHLLKVGRRRNDVFTYVDLRFSCYLTMTHSLIRSYVQYDVRNWRVVYSIISQHWSHT